MAQYSRLAANGNACHKKFSSKTKIVPNSVSAQKVAHIHYKSLADPVEGVTITQLDALLFHVSTNIRDGIYEGLSIHSELKIPENYPFSPPFGEIVPGYMCRLSRQS